MESDSPVGTPTCLLELADILLVEDDPWSVQLTSEMLGFIGCRVVVVGSGLDALNAVKLHPYAMVLMDCRLPEMSGPDATRAIRAIEARLSWPATPIVALTASVMPDEVANCLSSGMNEVIRKPVSLDELRVAVLKWCSTPRVIRPAMQSQTVCHEALSEVTCGGSMEADLVPMATPSLSTTAIRSRNPVVVHIPSAMNTTAPNTNVNAEAALAAMLELLDGPAEEAFDRVTRLASNVLNAPLALITLLDTKQQRVKSSVGWTIAEVPRFISFCAHAVDACQALVVQDALADKRFANNPMVRGEPHIRFYAGQPIHSSGGIALGTLCVMDRQAREWSPREGLILADLAKMVEKEIAHRESDRVASRAFKQRDRLARDSESRLQATFDQAAVGIALVGLDGAWQRVNRRLCDIVGYSESELLRLTFQDITHPSDLQEDLLLVQQLLEGKSHRYCLEKRYVRKDGQIVWINLTVALIRTSDNEPDYFISVIEDIHQRKEAEASLAAMGQKLEQIVRTRTLELEQANERLAVAVQQSKLVDRSLASREAELLAILHNAPDAYISMDEAGYIIEWNRQAELTFGWKRSEVLGCSMHALIIPVEHHALLVQCMKSDAGEDAPLTLTGKRVELTVMRRDGTALAVELRISAIPSERGQLYCVFLHDITERNTLHASLMMQALRDSLTGLPNRRALSERLPQAIARAQRSGHALAVLFMDLDGFKKINDELGHLSGDLLLQQFATRVATCIRRTDTLARLDGDEFVALLEGMGDSQNDPMCVARKILSETAKPFELNGASGSIGVSIGVTVFHPGESASAETLLNAADSGMYKAKAMGRGQACRVDVDEMDGAVLTGRD
jgi:diguanylate cyclase (GGDEF)-like protein/PAS domain S-box-containing protein